MLSGYMGTSSALSWFSWTGDRLFAGAGNPLGSFPSGDEFSVVSPARIEASENDAGKPHTDQVSRFHAESAHEKNAHNRSLSL